MPPHAIKEARPPATRRTKSVGVSPTTEARARLLEEAKAIFNSRLERAQLQLPKAQADINLAAFESAVTEILARLSEVDATLEGMRQTEGTPEAAKPNARLRRAMASANRIERGRFSTADELFRSLGQTAQK